MVIGVLSTVAAITAPSILTLLLVTQQLFAGATFVPILAGLYWRRANSTGAMAALLAGGSGTLIATLLDTALEPLLIGIGCSIAGLLAGVFFGRAETRVLATKDMDFSLRSELPWFAAVVVFCGLFFWGAAHVENWPWMIGLSLGAMSLCVVLLIVFFFTDLRARTRR